MNKSIGLEKLAFIAGISYWIIFFSAIFANFGVIEALKADPLTATQHPYQVSLGILLFLITVIFDIVVAWALYEMFKDNTLSLLSTLFRMMHASIMAVAIFALPAVLNTTSVDVILQQIDIFNTIWLIGLFFFGIHLLLLACIIGRPKLIALFLFIAGLMYIIDTLAHFIMPNYENYASIFLAAVAIPSVLGEMSFAIWLLVKSIKK